MKNVLIVDDNPIVRRHLRGLLERDACVVREAKDGVEGLAAAQEEKFDVIFLDLDMPNLDGAGVLRELQRLKLKTPTVLISASESSAELVNAFKLGAKEYLVKPFKEAQVRNVMQQLGGLDPAALIRTNTDIALLDSDEGLAMAVRERCSGNDQLEHAEAMIAVPDVLNRKHQLVLIGAYEGGSSSEEAEALGDLVTQRDPDAALVRLLPPGESLPDVTVFHAGVSRREESEICAVINAARSGGVVGVGRKLRALRYAGPPAWEHLYWWSLLRSIRRALEHLFQSHSTAVVIDLSLAPANEAARMRLEETIVSETGERMLNVRFGRIAEPLSRPSSPGLTIATQGDLAATEGTVVRSAASVAAPAPAPASPAPRGDGAPNIPGYEVGALLGEGGMSRVYRALQKSLKRPVCIKVMRPELGQDPSLVDRFRDEGIALAALRHPNIVSVFDVGCSDDGQLFMIMEYVDGGDLRQLLKREGRLPLEESLHYGAQLLSGLAEAHGSGIVHRDIKPSNVLVGALKDGSKLVKLVDFGIAKLVEGVRDRNANTRMGAIIGTPGYMSPEQVLGMAITPAADLYAMGVLLFEMLTGRRAFAARDEFELARLTMLTPPPHLEDVLDEPVPPALDVLLHRLLAKNPSERPQSAAEVRAELLSLSKRRAA